jgi:phosphoribosylformylglycinamidine synthase
MDLKGPGNLLLIVGETDEGLGGSLWGRLQGLSGGLSPQVASPALSRLTFQKLHQAISRGLVRSCHDLSEGGLAVAVAEMALAGRLGADLDLKGMPRTSRARHVASLLFSESPSRFLAEVRQGDLPEV